MTVEWKSYAQSISVPYDGESYVLDLIQRRYEDARLEMICRHEHQRIYVGGNEWLCLEDGCHRVTWTPPDDEDNE